MPRFKSLLTLLELKGDSLHDEKHGRDALLEAWTDMAASDTGSAAWPGRLPSSGSTISVFVATAIVVADMVGLRVFTRLGRPVQDIPAGFSIPSLWTVGGAA